MLTPEQEKWIDHLSDTDVISIVPFDPTVEEKFRKVKTRIQHALGSDVNVEHHGASSLGISGQDEIDVYLPIEPEQFETLINNLKSLFDEPRSYYPLKRARFVTEVDGKHIDVFLINKESDDWKNMLEFEALLRENHKILKEYKNMKELGNGLSTREYYRRKLEFINQIL